MMVMIEEENWGKREEGASFRALLEKSTFFKKH